MRIQNNIMAMNSYRNYSNNTSALSKNLEKLSSGYKINRAGDDAAGLAISEKMRAQITGLDTAQKNAKDGISLIQTAEGALAEVHDMLNRMYELANQSANGTYDNEVDRANLQKEVTALKEEINRISDSANFNGINLLDGTQADPEVTTVGSATILTGLNVEVEGLENFEFNFSTNADTDGDGSVTASFVDGKLTIDYMDKNGSGTAPDAAAVKSAIDAALGVTTTGTVTIPTASVTETSVNQSSVIDFEGVNAQYGGTITVGNTTYEIVESAADADDANTALVIADITNTEDIAAKLADAVGAGTASGSKFTTEAAATATAVETNGVGGLKLQVGDTSESFNQMTVVIGDLDTTGLGIADIDISNQADAAAATDLIKAAINTVSSTRGDLGALQNRLDHTINNLSVMEENIQDAESTIRDTDVAEEMMAYTKNNILIQSAQAMLAQANQVPQGVLQLLQ